VFFFFFFLLNNCPAQKMVRLTFGGKGPTWALWTLRWAALCCCLWAFTCGNLRVSANSVAGSSNNNGNDISSIDPNANPNDLIDNQIKFIKNLLAQLPDGASVSAGSHGSMKAADLWRRLGLLLQTKDIRQHVGGGLLQPEALDAFDKAIMLNDDRDGTISYQVYEHRGILLKMMGRGEEAIISHNFAIDFAANKVEKCEAMSNKAAALVMLGRVSAAATLYKQTISLCPDKTSYFLPLVQCYLELGGANVSAWQELMETVESVLPVRESFAYYSSPDKYNNANKQLRISVSGDATDSEVDNDDEDEHYDSDDENNAVSSEKSSSESSTSGVDTAFNRNHGSSVYWALFEVAHRLGAYAKAWFYLEKAHVVESLHRNVDMGADESIATQVNQIKSIFTPSFWPVGVGLESKAPVFIVGMMR
jgi:hypothetical protein